jgi:hypothetical protein
VPGIEIPSVDFLSRISQDAELSLPDEIFRAIVEIFGARSVDLFASYRNRKLERFVSLLPEKGSFATDAFSLRWPRNAYAFPPFNQIGRILSKVRREFGEIVLITPMWESATWWPTLHQLATSLPLIYRAHLLDRKLRKKKIKWPLVVWKLSGNPWKTGVFQKRSSNTSSPPPIMNTFMIPIGEFLEIGV